MRLLKPTWVSQDGRPIFSIDIHPDGSRFATGGQSDDSGNVVIWNMAPVREERDEKDENVPKVLCQMDDHLACVNCVRWSLSGKFLASCGDDKLIMIWQISKYARPTSMFGSNVVNVESWRPVSTLRGHLGDVLDLAWSPRDIWLASCSVDNTVIVWNAMKFPEQITTLKGHSGLVKGVTWDPVGKYLATQSDDKTLRVWRTLDWQQEKCVAEPFKECGGTTHVLRLNWSPDGHYIVSAHAMNNSGPTAQIIERDGWKATLDFVGHRKAISVVRFNPKILTKKIKKDSAKSHQYSCCAIGSKDRSLSIWLTALRRPLVVTHDLFNNSVMDVSWSQSGLELMCCSIDGTVAYVDFTPEEIGHALSSQEVQNLLEKIYGKSLPIHTSATVNTASQVIESAALLNLQQKEKEKRELPQDADSKSKLQVNGETPFKPRDKQIETKTADGRRRITPIFLAPQPEIGFEDAPQPFTTKKIEFSSSERHSSIQIQKLDKVTGPGLMSSSSQSMQSPPSSGLPDAKTPSTGDAPKTPSTSDAKTPSAATAVFQPMKALEKTPSKSDRPKPTAPPDTPPSTVTTEKSVDEKKEEIEREKEKQRDYHRAKLASGLSVKRKIEERRPGKVGRPRKIDREAREAERASMSMSQNQSGLTTPLAPDREIIRHIPAVTSDLLLPVPVIEKSEVKQILGKSGQPGSILLDVCNDVSGGTPKLHKVSCMKDENVVWEQVMTSKVNLVAGSSHVFCIACENHSVSFFSEGGRKILPTIVLNSNVAFLRCNNYYVLAITRRGSLHVWNLQARCAIIKNENLSSVTSGSDKVEKVSLTSEGIPIITLSTRKSYTFSIDLAAWILVNDRRDSLHICSDHHGCLPSGSVTTLTGPLSSLQANPDRPGHKAAGMFGSTPELKQTATLSHLETQVAVCLNLKSSSEYKFWLLTYVRYLVQEGFETQLREICNDLLGPLYKSKKASAWQESTLGLNKRDLLREILPIIGSNLRWQRLYTEYQEQLDSV